MSAGGIGLSLRTLSSTTSSASAGAAISPFSAMVVGGAAIGAGIAAFESIETNKYLKRVAESRIRQIGPSMLDRKDIRGQEANLMTGMFKTAMAANLGGTAQTQAQITQAISDGWLDVRAIMTAYKQETASIAAAAESQSRFLWIDILRGGVSGAIGGAALAGAAGLEPGGGDE